MKKMTSVLAAAAVLAAAVSCGHKKEAPKMLVLYYTQTSNTEVVAEAIATALGADVEEIVSIPPYDGDFQATIDRCMKEREAGILPEIQPVKADIAAYDVIFLGYPIWFGTYAPPVTTWLKNVDLSGKKVVPFCTFGSGGLDSSVKDLKAAQPAADILEGYGVRAARIAAVPREVNQFLKRNGFLEGDYVKLEDFPEQHPASAEEAAIFAAAIADYPMLQGVQAKTVAARVLPEGMEYLFTAMQQPRGNDPKMPPASEMKVYVTVEEGQAPVFTQVVR
jgi:flavodoxin